MTEDIKMLREALEMAAEHYEPLGTRRAEELLAALGRIAEAVADRDALQDEAQETAAAIFALKEQSRRLHASRHADRVNEVGGVAGGCVAKAVAQDLNIGHRDTCACLQPAPCVPAETLEEMLRTLFHLRDPRHTQAAKDAAYRGRAALTILTRRLAEATSERDGLRLASGPGHSCVMLAARLNQAEAERDSLRGQLEAHSDAKRCEEATARLLADYDTARTRWTASVAALRQAESALFLLTVADTEHNRKLRDEALEAVTRALGDEGACRGRAR